MDTVDLQVIAVESSAGAGPHDRRDGQKLHGRRGELYKCSISIAPADSWAVIWLSQDLTELASARKLETSATYAPQSQQPTYDPLMGIFGPSGEESTAVPASAALASLIEPASTRVGAKLMRKMGWREGQGVGPRVTHAQRKAQAAELGVQLDAEEDDDDETADGETVRHYFAPLDRPQKVLQGVSVTAEKGWGLGYKAGPNMAQALGTDGSSSRRAAGMAMAFDEDDEDNVYGDEAVDLPSSRLKVMEVGEADHDFGRRGKSRRPEQVRLPHCV